MAHYVHKFLPLHQIWVVTMKRLFEIELQYKPEMAPVSPATGKIGEYIGSGEGCAKGKVRGTVHWDLFEKQEDVICESNLRGLIETQDGATILFDTLGFFRRPDKPGDQTWVNAAAVRFETADERYAWLNTLIGIWQGVFDMGTYRHQYQVYVNVDHNSAEENDAI